MAIPPVADLSHPHTGQRGACRAGGGIDALESNLSYGSACFHRENRQISKEFAEGQLFGQPQYVSFGGLHHPGIAAILSVYMLIKKMRKQEDKLMIRKQCCVVLVCLLAVLFLTACGGNARETDSPAAPAQPVKTEAPTVTPSAAPDEAVEQTGETGADDAVNGAENQDRQSAAGPFAGVMGTEFVVPEGFVQLYESPSIGYQYTFWHPDYEIRIVVYEIAPGYIPEGAYETDYQIASKNPDVTYLNKGESWFVQSGYNNIGKEIFYSKESSTDSGLKTFWVTYPTAKREFGDTIAADFEKNCRFDGTPAA